MKKSTLALLVLAAAASVGQAEAATYISSVSSEPLELESLENGSQTKVLIYAGGANAVGFLKYVDSEDVFMLDSSKATTTSFSDMDATIYTYTLYKDDNGLYSIQTHVNNKYIPAWLTNSSYNAAVDETGGDAGGVTFYADLLNTLTGTLSGKNMYKLTSSQASSHNGDYAIGEGVVCKQSYRLLANTNILVPFEFYAYEEAQTVNVTYNYYLDGSDTAITETKTYNIGTSIAMPTAPDFTTFNSVKIGDEALTGEFTPNGDTTVDITVTTNLPFTLGAFYFLHNRPGVDPTWSYYDESNNITQTDSDDNISICKNALWKIERVDGTIDQFKIYNAGQGKYINGSGLSADGESYILKSATSNASSNLSGLPTGKTGFEFVVASTPTTVLGTHGGATGKYPGGWYGTNDKYSHWSSGKLDDAGSIFWVESLGEVFPSQRSELTTVTGTFPVASSISLPEGGATLDEIEAFFNTTLNWSNRTDSENALYRFKSVGQSGRSITMSGYANTSGNIDDFDSDGGETTRLVNTTETDANNFSQLWLITPYDNSTFVIQTVNGNTYGMGSPGNDDTHATATTTWSAHITPEANDGNGRYVLSLGGSYVNIGNWWDGYKVCYWYNAFDDTNNIFEVERVTEVSLTMPETGFTTFCAPIAVTVPSGVTVYTAGEYANDNGTEYVKITAFDGSVLPAKTGVLLSGTAGETYTFSFTSDPGTTVSDNSFTGVTIERRGYDDGAFHVLDGAAEDGNAKFAVSTSTNATANTAILVIDKTADVEAVTVFPETVGINEVGTSSPAKVEFYNLQGVKVTHPVRGIYVTSDGEKVFVN
jgi:hypothetical protein